MVICNNKYSIRAKKRVVFRKIGSPTLLYIKKDLLRADLFKRLRSTGCYPQHFDFVGLYIFLLYAADSSHCVELNRLRSD